MSEEIVIKNQETKRLRVSIKSIGWPMGKATYHFGPEHESNVWYWWL